MDGKERKRRTKIALLTTALVLAVAASPASADTTGKKTALSNNYAGNSWRQAMLQSWDDNPILSLAGVNQQKALFARALGSDAPIVLMDDPMRGVYDLVRREAAGGRLFLWYTIEVEELRNCDHVCVFRHGRIVADPGRAELSEQQLIRASFQETT